MYIKLSDGTYPVYVDQIRAENPEEGIPPDAETVAVLHLGYARVEPTEQPTPSPTQRITEGIPVEVDGEYRQSWVITDWTAEEVAAAQKAQADALVKQYDGIVQKRLDDAARGFGYGDPNRPEISPILHVISYADEPAIVDFQAEGRLFRACRSRTWAKSAEILNAVTAGDRPVPTEAELLAELDDAVPLPTVADVDAEIARLTSA